MRDYFFRGIPGLDQLLNYKMDHFGRPIKDVTNIPVIWNGQNEAYPEYTTFNKYNYSPRFFATKMIADMSKVGEKRELNPTEIYDLNKERGEIALSLFNETQEQVTTAIDNLPEGYRNKVFKGYMDNIFKAATGVAKIKLMFPEHFEDKKPELINKALKSANNFETDVSETESNIVE